MPPPPKVDPEIVRQAFFTLAERLGRPASAAEVADHVEKTTAVRLSPSGIRSMVRSKGWTDLPRAKGAAGAAMEYRIEARLGPVKATHARSHFWFLETAYERAQAGLTDAEGVNAQAGKRLVDDLLHYGDVLDYDPEGQGFYTRPAWPWELGDHISQRERPEGWVQALHDALKAGERYQGVEVTDAHRQMWAKAITEALEELG